MNLILFELASHKNHKTCFSVAFLWPRLKLDMYIFNLLPERQRQTARVSVRAQNQILLLLIRVRVFQFAGSKREIKSATAFDSAAKCLLLTWSIRLHI